MRYGLALMALAFLALLPVAAACNGLSPGDEFNYTRAGSGYVCTLAFIVADENGVYFATAGHCVSVNTTVRTPDGKTFGVGAFHHLVPETGSESDGRPGDDFALIRIDPAWYDKLNPAVCGWGGPKGIYRESPGGGDVHHYGWGTGISAVSPKRSGTNLENNNTSFHWLGEGLPGDSGSAVLAADGRALGVLTHLTPGELFSVRSNGGTHLDRGFQLAAAAGFPHLRLVLESEDPVAIMQQVKANLTNAPAPPASGNPTLPTAGGSASPPPTTSTPPTTTPSTPTQGGAVQPAAVQDDSPNNVPGPGLALVIGIVAALALRRPKTL